MKPSVCGEAGGWLGCESRRERELSGHAHLHAPPLGTALQYKTAYILYCAVLPVCAWAGRGRAGPFASVHAGISHALGGWTAHVEEGRGKHRQVAASSENDEWHGSTLGTLARTCPPMPLRFEGASTYVGRAARPFIRTHSPFACSLHRARDIEPVPPSPNR